MGSQLAYYSLTERFKLNSVLGKVVAQYGNPKGSREAIAVTINALETALDKDKNEWIYWYTLGEYYLATEEFAKFFYAAQKCFDLKPKDVRSSYVLATACNELSKAKFVGDTERFEEVATLVGLNQLPADYVYNPEKCQEALEELGLTIDQCAMKAITLFQMLLREKLPPEDKKNIQVSLEGLQYVFPNLR